MEYQRGTRLYRIGEISLKFQKQIVEINSGTCKFMPVI